jgi:hypothetical protein
MTIEEKEMKNKRIEDAMNSIETRLRHVYDQGYADGIADGNINSGLFADKVREAYNNGLEDAWECARKILFDISLPRDILTELGADSFCGVIHKCSASEVIKKIKEYEEQQKQIEKKCSNCKYCFTDGYYTFCSHRQVGECCINKDMWELKQTEEKTDKSCESCRFVDFKAHQFPCSCCSKAYGLRWQLKEGDS